MTHPLPEGGGHVRAERESYPTSDKHGAWPVSALAPIIQLSPAAMTARPIFDTVSKFTRPRFVPTIERPSAKPQVDRWGGQDLNLRPTDYESAALTN